VAPSRLSRPGWKILGAVLFLALCWAGLPRLAKRLDFFRVTKVEVRGLVNFRPEQVVKALPLPPGMSIFDDVAPVRAAAESLAGVEAANVGRRLPGTLVVTVREARPVALVMRQGRLQLVSERGRLLPFDPTVAAPDLPLVQQADSLVAGLLARVRDADATLFASVVSGSRSGDDVVLTVDGRRYWFRPDASAEVIRAVTAVAEDLARKGRRWAELDARFSGMVVVRWGAGAA
jgi:cell division septal protein FtsQ